MKRILTLLIVSMLFVLPLTSAILDSRDAVSDGSLTRGGQCNILTGCDSGSDSPSQVKSGGGSTFLTKWVYDGTTCRKQDIITFPVQFGINSRLAPGYYEVQYNRPASEGKKWVSKVIPGKFGVVLDKNRKLVLEPECPTDYNDENMSIQITPLTINWWQNYFN